MQMDLSVIIVVRNYDIPLSFSVRWNHPLRNNVYLAFALLKETSLLQGFSLLYVRDKYFEAVLSLLHSFRGELPYM